MINLSHIFRKSSFAVQKVNYLLLESTQCLMDAENVRV